MAPVWAAVARAGMRGPLQLSLKVFTSVRSLMENKNAVPTLESSFTFFQSCGLSTSDPREVIESQNFRPEATLEMEFIFFGIFFFF